MPFIFQDVCIRKLLANQLVMKMEIKSISEQLKLMNSTQEKQIIDSNPTTYSSLDCLFPLTTENDIISIDNQIQSSPSYRKKLLCIFVNCGIVISYNIN